MSWQSRTCACRVVAYRLSKLLHISMYFTVWFRIAKKLKQRIGYSIQKADATNDATNDSAWETLEQEEVWTAFSYSERALWN
jgi:hypothetical protein